MRQMQGQWAQLESWWPGMACHAQGAAAQQRGWNINNNYSQQQQQQPQQWVSFIFELTMFIFVYQHIVSFSLWQLSFFFRCGWLRPGYPVNSRESRWIFAGTDWTHSEAHGEEPWFRLPNHRAWDFTLGWLLSDPHVISKGELYDFWGNMTMKDESIETWSTWIYLDDIPEILRFASTTSDYELPILNKSEEPLRTWTEKQLRTEKQIMPLALLLLLSARVFPLLLG